jgi:type IV secretory pathway VirB2 component (pilin)
MRCVGSRVYREYMDYLKGPLYLDVAAKGLCLVGVMLMIFGQGGWFTAGVVTVVIGVLFGAWSMVAARRTRRRGWGGANRA